MAFLDFQGKKNALLRSRGTAEGFRVPLVSPWTSCSLCSWLLVCITSLEKIHHRIIFVNCLIHLPFEQSAPWKPFSQMHKFGPAQVP